MDGRGGCCIVRNGAHDMSTMEKIMLRFRPIAPKPVVPGTTTASDGTSSSDSGDALFKTSRTRRKYVKKLKQNNTTDKRRIRRKKNVSSPEQVQPVPVTLPLLPETPAKEQTLTEENNTNQWLSFKNCSKVEAEPYGWYSTVELEAEPYGWYSTVEPVTVRLTVECVTDAWVEGEGLGNTDEERSAKLMVDTCPGFISDGYGRVTWTNGAYKEMMGDGVVALVMKINGVVLYPSFTCRVRVVQFTCGNERNLFTLPCDVWRMDCGGFAWRLDVKAALSLRLGC